MFQQYLQNHRGVFAVIGGCFIHLIIGSFYLWGYISTYVVSYFIEKGDSNLTISQANLIFPIYNIISTLILSFGLKLAEKYGSRKMLFIAGSFYSLAILLSSLVNNFWWFFFFYAIVCGLGSGLSYIVPIKIVTNYFPERKALATACILSCYAFSSIVLSFMCVSIINPNNIKANIIEGQAIFPTSVNQQVPIALQYVSLYFFILTIIGSYLMKNKKQINSQQIIDTQQHQQEDTIDNTIQSLQQSVLLIQIDSTQTKIQDQEQMLIMIEKPLDALKTKEFYILFTMLFSSVIYGFFIASNFKSYGQLYINDDRYLSLVVGNASSISNGSIRFIIGYLQDKMGFRKVYMIVTIIQIIVISTLSLVNTSKILYVIWIILSMACEGSLFVLFPSKTTDIYGIQMGPKVYAFIFFAVCFGNLSQTFIVSSLVKIIPYQSIFYIFIAFTTLSLILNIIFPMKQFFFLTQSNQLNQTNNNNNINNKVALQNSL